LAAKLRISTGSTVTVAVTEACPQPELVAVSVKSVVSNGETVQLLLDCVLLNPPGSISTSSAPGKSQDSWLSSPRTIPAGEAANSVRAKSSTSTSTSRDSDPVPKLVAVIV